MGACRRGQPRTSRVVGEPWTTRPTKLGLPLPGRPVPLHPNAAGMRAVADLVTAASRKSAQRSPIMIDGALVLARGIRGSADASATRRFSTPRTRSFSSRALSGSTAHRDAAGRVEGRVRGFPHVRLDVRARPGQPFARDRGCDRLGGHDLAAALHRPNERFDVLAFGEQVHPDGRWDRGIRRANQDTASTLRCPIRMPHGQCWLQTSCLRVGHGVAGGQHQLKVTRRGVRLSIGYGRPLPPPLLASLPLLRNSHCSNHFGFEASANPT